MDQAGVRGEALAARQPLRDASRDHRLEQVPQQIAVAEAAVSALGEGRVVGHRIGQIEPAEPAVGKVEMNLIAEPALRSAALTSYRTSLAIAKTLAAQDPGNAGWQRGLSVSLDRIGNILNAQGKVDAALTSYHERLAIRETIAALNNGSIRAELDLVVSHTKVSTASVAPRPDLKAALAILLRLQSEGRLPPANESWIGLIEAVLRPP